MRRQYVGWKENWTEKLNIHILDEKEPMMALSRDGLLKVGRGGGWGGADRPQSTSGMAHSYSRLADRLLILQPDFRNSFLAFAFLRVMSFSLALANTNKWGQWQLGCASPFSNGLTRRTMHLFVAIGSSGRICHHCGECQRDFRLPVTVRIEHRRKASQNPLTFLRWNSQPPYPLLSFNGNKLCSSQKGF